MTILFSADWHIKLGQKNVPVQWAKSRYYEFFNQLKQIQEAQDVHLHIIGGDIFDRVPTIEELEIFIDYVKECSVETIIYDGNHEATKKNKTFFAQLSSIVNAVNSKVHVVTENYEDPRGFCILPYCELYRKDAIEELPRKPLFTHVRGAIPPHVTPEVDLDRFHKFPVVFAGDLHSHTNCQQNIVYPGSPMTTSFHRSKVETGVLIIYDDWDWHWERLHLPQLIRRTVKKESEMIPGTYDHVIYEIEGDMSDLSQVKSNELLDKKVIKRNSEASLILSKEMSIAEELIEYLTYILQLPEPKVQTILGTFNDFSSQIEME